MANASLAAGPLSCNDIYRLTHWFNLNFHDCRGNISHEEQGYFRQSNARVVGLSFTAVLINNEFFLMTEYLKQFLQFRLYCFACYSGDLSVLAIALAKLLNVAMDSCNALVANTSYLKGFVRGLRRSSFHYPLVHVADKLQEGWQLFGLLMQRG